MGANKRDYMDIQDPLSARYYSIIQKAIEEEQMLYETLCDNSPKDNLNNG